VELLESLTVVDDYRGDGVPEGHKSLTFALGSVRPDRTLTQAEATEAKEAGVALAPPAMAPHCGPKLLLF
jgi:phenylalanyl-tRNA synthetase beta chain